jgi:hypothetical protein
MTAALPDVLQRLFDELKTVTVEEIERVSSDTPSSEGEIVVGVLSEYARSLLVLNIRYKRELKRVSMEMLDAKKSELIQYMAKARIADAFDDALRNLFWLQVRLEFPILAHAPAIGFRKDWQVVVMQQGRKKSDIGEAIAQQLAEMGELQHMGGAVIVTGDGDLMAGLQRMMRQAQGEPSGSGTEPFDKRKMN